MGGGAGDGGLPGFQRLAQSLQRGAGEFRHFVHEQHAAMRERHFAGPGTVAAAADRRHARRMVGRAEGRTRDQPAAFEQARHRMHHAHLQRGARAEIRQQARQALRQHRFAAAGRADHQDVVTYYTIWYNASNLLKDWDFGG